MVEPKRVVHKFVDEVMLIMDCILVQSPSTRNDTGTVMYWFLPRTVEFLHSVGTMAWS